MIATKAVSSESVAQTGSEGRPAEPSMEDILASIRRIIADDQSRQAMVSASSRSSSPSAFPHREPGLSRTLAEAAAPSPAPAPSKSLLRPAAAEIDPPPSRISASPHLNPPVIPASTDATHSVIDEISSVGVASALKSVALDQGASSVTAPAVTAAPSAETRVPPAEPSSREPAVTIEPVGAGEAPPVVAVETRSADEVAEEPQPEQSGGASASAEPLVSPEAFATIESSFQALTTSVFMQNTGLVESLVRDMLRPMLKSWLDDNLPAIVERLVRIEIERVSRGGRA